MTTEVQPEYGRRKLFGLLHSGEPGATARSVLAWCSLAALCLVFFVGSGFRFAGAGHDDTFIMLWAGESLGDSEWFVNYNGDLEEIATSVLAPLIIKVCASVLPTKTLAAWKFVSAGAATMTLVSVFLYRRAIFGREAGLAVPLFVVAMLAVSPHFQYWSWGGLETPWQVLLVCGILIGVGRMDASNGQAPRRWILPLVAVALWLNRADALWVLAIPLCWAISDTKCPRRTRWVVAIFPLVALAIFLAVRWKMTGALLPNPAYAKVSPSLESVRDGLDYFSRYHRERPILAALLVAYPIAVYALGRWLIALFRGRRPLGVLEAASIAVLASDGITLLVGGNWMGFHRFAVHSLLPKLVVLSIVLVALLQFLRRLEFVAWRQAANLRWVAMAVALLAVVDHSQARGISTTRTLEWPEVWLLFQRSPTEALMHLNSPNWRDMSQIQPFIDAVLPQLMAQQRQKENRPFVVASYQAGYFPYSLRKRFSSATLRFVDPMGLATGAFSRLPGKRNPYGMESGLRPDKLLLDPGTAGVLFRRYQPDLIYMVGPGFKVNLDDPDLTENFMKSGYREIWRRRNTVVYYRSIN